VVQGAASGDEFRTAAAFGALVRGSFSCMDGRTKDLLQAIAAHQGQGSEANGVIRKFRMSCFGHPSAR